MHFSKPNAQFICIFLQAGVDFINHGRRQQNILSGPGGKAEPMKMKKNGAEVENNQDGVWGKEEERRGRRREESQALLRTKARAPHRESRQTAKERR